MGKKGLLVIYLLLGVIVFSATRGKKVKTTGTKLEKKIDSQVDSRFPDRYMSSRVFVRNKRRFNGYKGEGKIQIDLKTATSAVIKINGKKVPINRSQFKKKRFTVDISKYTKTGINTLHVSEIKPLSGILNVNVTYATLEKGSARRAGFSQKKLKELDKFIEKEVKEGFPGAVLLVAKDGKIIHEKAYGYRKKYDSKGKLLKNPVPMTLDTVFDLASNTKMYATNIAMMKLISEAKIDPNDLVKKYLPNYTGQGRDKRTVRDLLNHTAGYAPEIHFHNKKNKYHSLDRNKTIDMLVTKIPFRDKLGEKTTYSDTAYMLLGTIVEKVTGKRLDKYVEEEIYKPLGLKNTMYIPKTKGIPKDKFAATEIFGNTRGLKCLYDGVRKYTLQGEVHDEKAYYSMGGVSGHAGLFSTGRELLTLTQLMLNNGGYGGLKIFDEDTLVQAIKPSDYSLSYGLGWARAGDGIRKWQFGPYASSSAYGHTGWTGTLTVVDPEFNMSIVLLTNVRHSLISYKRGNRCGLGEFESKKFETGNYGSIVAKIYEALLEN